VSASKTAGGRGEFALAVLALGVPLWFLASEITPQPFVFGWSKRWCCAVVAYAAFFGLALWSYRWKVPHALALVRKAVVALALSSWLALGGVEFALRITNPPAFEPLDNSGRHSADPDVGHVYKLNHTQVLQSREFRVVWSSNAQGVRAERDFGPKPQGVARVLCVGDSFTACDQVDYPQSWPAVLERCLADELGAGRVEVINAGFPGFGTVNASRWIAKFGAAFEPDIVLVAMTPNDLLENQFPLQYTARDGALVSSASTAADRERHERRGAWWRLAAAVERSHLAERLRRSPNLKRLVGLRPFNHLEAYLVERNEKAQRLYELAEQYLLEARANSQALGASFAVLVIPYSHQLAPLGAGLDPGRFGEHWRAFGAAQGFAVADARESFLAHPAPHTLHWKEDTHCTAEGYALVARTACQLLLEQRDALGLTEALR
jgi:lysophospholipase L1-like esterase